MHRILCTASFKLRSSVYCFWEYTLHHLCFITKSIASDVYEAKDVDLTSNHTRSFGCCGILKLIIYTHSDNILRQTLQEDPTSFLFGDVHPGAIRTSLQVPFQSICLNSSRHPPGSQASQGGAQNGGTSTLPTFHCGDPL